MTKWLSHIGAAALLLVMLVKTASMPIVCIDYAINQDFIARSLCENKAKPAMHCHGKCFMKKQLIRTSENQDGPCERGNIRSTLLDFSETPVDSVLNLSVISLPPTAIHSGSSLPESAGNELLRPPIA